MASTAFDAHGYRMGPQIRVRSLEVTADMIPPSAPAPLAARDDDCDAESANFCEKPVSSQSMTLPIVLGVVIPLVAAIGVLIFLHRRNVKKQRREEAADPNRDLDFGLDGEVTEHRGGKRQSLREKMMRADSKHRVQISMDMNLSSPYLLPPGLQSSRESLHSLARTLHTSEDPYRPVNQYGSEVGSIRSFHRDKDSRAGSSIYTGSTERQSSVNGRTLPPRQGSLPRPPPPTADPFATPTSPAPPRNLSSTSPPRQPLPQGIVPEMGTVPYPNDRSDDWSDNSARIPDVPDVVEPLPVANRALGSSIQRASPPPPAGSAALNNKQAGNLGAPSLPEIGVGFDFTMPDGPSSTDANSHHRTQHNQQETSSFSPLPTIIPEEETSSYVANYDQRGQEEDDYEERGRSAQRRSMDGDYRKSQALGVPQQDTKRLSVGLRPLPPDEVTESEDPEERANRIRSFYKEYFDDSRPAEPLPPPPQQQYGTSYYEDYDPKYLEGESAFYDPDSHAFVMPYAQPVTRRAMTPPPSGSRLRGPPPPRAMHGSVSGGGMSMPGGRRPPPPRAGTSMSNRWGPPSRPGSSLSSSYGHPRPGSSVSSRLQQPGKPKGPPPAPLTTLPTPSKLKDDSLALLGSIDFAPPESYEDRQRGRSQSPMGERRPFAPKKPVASPLVSSFDEMPAVPSPHLLRKSGTFTGLDFAPPRRFANDDGMSDAGSIRSNRSGLSAVQAHAIRSGVGRVSRLPEDTVFTQAKMEATLKPSWNMRD
ncbi:hypothetical protein SODALDRAFT_272364 [Sodiomyces alkalinus F11]|uniref:Uncharacterized protein n=1 Tax=Sodiomyces alkalinus (strain CBS 110278 / VKM F-3762 / F11) TaxID=1314773 RepID=A0A3N2Q0V6_SODAK|nr:hypothetical protein SODALDRAFT_272364 [Sodiomyces alkalinus F11]ROT40245.1 hypothetical protein SODALDRAFT_272364 [Sodiomyces alkalinus F11]